MDGCRGRGGKGVDMGLYRAGTHRIVIGIYDKFIHLIAGLDDIGIQPSGGGYQFCSVFVDNSRDIPPCFHRGVFIGRVPQLYGVVTVKEVPGDKLDVVKIIVGGQGDVDGFPEGVVGVKDLTPLVSDIHEEIFVFSGAQPRGGQGVVVAFLQGNLAKGIHPQQNKEKEENAGRRRCLCFHYIIFVYVVGVFNAASASGVTRLAGTDYCHRSPISDY